MPTNSNVKGAYTHGAVNFLAVIMGMRSDTALTVSRFFEAMVRITVRCEDRDLVALLL